MQKDQILVKENPASNLLEDAKNCLEEARVANQSGDRSREEMWSRITTLLFATALEAFINYVYTYCEVEPKQWMNLSFKGKWLQASAKCLPNMGKIVTLNQTVYQTGDSISTFDESKAPFSMFLELKSVRNQLVHLKPSFKAITFPSSDKQLTGELVYQETGLPKQVSLFNLSHAETAEHIYNEMTCELDRQMFGTISKLFDGQPRIEVRTDSLLGSMIEELLSEEPK